MTYWVNSDPGKWITYFGYALLFLGLIWNLFDPNSRVQKLVKRVRGYEGALVVLLLFQAPMFGSSYEDEYFNDLKNGTVELANEFGRLTVQTRGGRLKPLDTLNREIMRKVTGSEEYRGLNANQAVLGMMTHQRLWRRVPLILVKDPKIKEMVGLPQDQKLAMIDYNVVSLLY